MNRSVVVVSMAAWTPYGRGLDAFWQGLAGMESARRDIARLDVSHWAYRSKSAAAIPELPGDASGDDRCAHQIMQHVVDDVLAELDAPAGDLSPYDTGLCLGSSHGGATGRFVNFLRSRLGYPAEPEPPGSNTWLSSAAFLSDLAARLDAQGPSAMISTACASGTSSIGIGYDWIRHGRATRVFAGGYGYFSDISVTGFNILRLVGKNGCHPFDVARDGMMLGDGFALVVLEDEEFARRRGASIIARVAGYCAVNEAHHATSPDPSGDTALRAMWNALGKSQERLDRLGYINAHGTGTEANDKAELTAIRRLLSGRRSGLPVGVSSTKGHHGHSLGATGNVEFVAMLLALQRGCVPATVGLENPEPDFADIDLVRGAARPQEIHVALSNSFAFGGNTAAIAVERAD
ncbi:MAG: beta-ketoacyl-[acyl-carrier-protein] synthase family protein [Candidatus Solibacter sp.]